MSPTRPIEGHLVRLGLKHAALAEFMGVDPSTLSKKVSGDRRWTQEDINSALTFFRQFDPSITYEALFAQPETVAS